MSWWVYIMITDCFTEVAAPLQKTANSDKTVVSYDLKYNLSLYVNDVGKKQQQSFTDYCCCFCTFASGKI